VEKKERKSWSLNTTTSLDGGYTLAAEARPSKGHKHKIPGSEGGSVSAGCTPGVLPAVSTSPAPASTKLARGSGAQGSGSTAKRKRLAAGKQLASYVAGASGSWGLGAVKDGRETGDSAGRRRQRALHCSHCSPSGGAAAEEENVEHDAGKTVKSSVALKMLVEMMTALCLVGAEGGDLGGWVVKEVPSEMAGKRQPLPQSQPSPGQYFKKNEKLRGGIGE